MNYSNVIDILLPDSKYAITDNQYSTLVWDNTNILEKPTEQEIINKAKVDFKSSKITIASMSMCYLRDNSNYFLFEKNANSSQNFIKLLMDSDLIICSDSAPLHIASAFNKHVIAVFNSTAPETVINSGDELSIYEI